MKAKIIFSLFILLIFISGVLAGAYAGVSASSASMTNELWAGGQTMKIALHNLNNNEVDKAKALLCGSITARLAILNMAKPMLSEQQIQELNDLQQAVMTTDDGQLITDGVTCKS